MNSKKLRYHFNNLFIRKIKGFTLIELLAVIVVLGVVALITVPIVLNIIEDARIGAAVSSAKSYIKATETYVVTNQKNKKDALLNNNKYNVTRSTKVEDKTYEAINNLTDIKGAKPNGIEDYIILGDTYQVEEAKLTINDYEILVRNDEVIKVTKIGNIVVELLSDKASIGDYVAYDAGEWMETKDIPTSRGQFGGYTKGQNKANSVVCSTASTLKGWRVLSIDKNTNTVTIIHAGQSECYYHGIDSASSIINLNNRASSQYLNDTYASSAHVVNKEEIDTISATNNLRKTGGCYLLTSSPNTADLYLLIDNGNITNTRNRMYGVRPVVVLRPNTKTTGRITDVVGQEAWNLIAP